MTPESAVNLIWKCPPQTPTLKDREIHIWRANLELPLSNLERLTTFLSADEIIRANRFRFPQHQRRFIASRGILRQLLGNYLGINASKLVFAYEARGKPFLALPQNQSLQFNISHSHEYALLAFTREHQIGVDIEYQRPIPDALKIANRFFSATESQLLKQAPESEQANLFFQLWTAKEAYLKALGMGLSGSLSSVEIALDSSKQPYIHFSASDCNSDWLLHPCIPAPNYVGATAVNIETAPAQILFFNWQ
ncbi:MAG: 4'-phosphopantetheinyl transferase superfamily protein [Cyanobacteria bacterium J06623_7]